MSVALRALSMAALVLGLAAAGSGKHATLTNVTLQEIAGATQLSFNADQPVGCENVATMDPTVAVFDVVGANHTLPHSAALEGETVQALKTDIWHTEDGTPVTRVTLHLSRPAKHWVEAREKGFTVMVEPEGEASPQGETSQPSQVSASATDMPPSVEAMASEAVASSPAPEPASEPESTEQSGISQTTEGREEAPVVGTSETWGEVRIEGGATPAPAIGDQGSAYQTTPAPEPGHQGSEYQTQAPTPGDQGWQPQAAQAPTEAEEAPKTIELTPIQELMMGPLTFTPLDGSGSGRFADGGPRVSLDVQGADVRTVMRSLAEYSGENIVVGKDVQGFVTVNLTEVPWVDALETICRTQALGWVDEDGIIRVETMENLRKEEVARSQADRQLEDLQPLTTQIVRAVYATASELKASISKTLTARGHVEVDPRTNSLVITDVARRVSAAVEMVRHLDSRTPQIEITAKLVDVDARFTRDLGITWGIGQVHSKEQAWSGELDISAGQVVDPAGRMRFGLVRSWGTINSMISALEQDNKADIISNPRITTVNNRQARILVGRKIPLIVLDEAGNAITQLITIGITLQVTPHINDDNRLTLDLHPEVSDLASQATVQGGIIINTSEADTRVIVDDGETAVIGGLIRSNTSKLKRGVPFLKDVPILGHLFSGTSEVKEKRELLIFITPKIVTNWAQTG